MTAPIIEATDTGWIITHAEGVITDGGKAGISPWMHDGRLFLLVGAQWWLADLESGDLSKAYVRTESGGRNNIPAIHPIGYYLATSHGVQVRDGSHRVRFERHLGGDGRWSLGAHHGPGNTAYVYQEQQGGKNRVVAVDDKLKVIDDQTLDVWHELYISDRCWYLRKRLPPGQHNPWFCSGIGTDHEWQHTLSHPGYEHSIAIGGGDRTLTRLIADEITKATTWSNGHCQIAGSQCVASYWDGTRDSAIGVFSSSDLQELCLLEIDHQPIVHGSAMQPPWNTHSDTDPGIWVRAVPSFNWQHDKISYRVPTSEGVPSVHVARLLSEEDELETLRVENEKMRYDITRAIDILQPHYGSTAS